MDKKKKARAKRLWDKYRWTLEMYDELFRLQNGVCYICGAPPKTVSLAVDHEHFKVKTERIPDGNWYAFTELNGQIIDAIQRTKKDAIFVCKSRALPLSVRGLLCTGHFGCNKRIGRVDKVEFLLKVIEYLQNPPAKKILDKQNQTVVVSKAGEKI